MKSIQVGDSVVNRYNPERRFRISQIFWLSNRGEKENECEK